MTIRLAHNGEHVYIRETTLKVAQPRGVSFRQWEATATPWVSGLTAVVLADGESLVVGFALESTTGVQVLYVRRKFRKMGFGAELMQGRRKDPVAVGFGPWSDWHE